MKKLVVILAVAGLILAGSTAAQAAVTFQFDPDDLIQLAPGSAGTSDVTGHNKATQPPQPNSYNTYMNWRDGLGANEGISAFNIWLLDNPRARSWGETTVWDPNGSAPTGTADAQGKWNVEVIPNPWGAGWLVQWWTDDSADYINASSNIGDFSFTGTAYHDTDADGYDADDPEVQIGETMRTWFGAVNWTESDGQSGWTQDWSLHFDDKGWGSREPNDGGPWAAGLVGSEGNGSGYEGVLDITAIPEPASIVIWSLIGGLSWLGLGVWRRRRGSAGPGPRSPWPEENRIAIRQIVDRGVMKG